MRGLFALRLAITVLAVVLGIGFLLRGDVVLGALLIAFAVTRVVMMRVMSRRRQQVRAEIRERRSNEG